MTMFQPADLPLPAPLNWCEIPAGKVALTDVKGYLAAKTTATVDDFSISQYPVTCAQYARFMDAGGYNERVYWTEAGWEWLTEEKVAEPDFWWNDYFNQPNRPVIGISLYEALAFCNWLTSRLERPGFRITLPTEAQWQRAAQGDDERVYPWGNDHDPALCNTKESGFVTTTDVTHYPQGASPFGVIDMSGNVWEWCITEWMTGNAATEGDETRVIRGGSWFDPANIARITTRRDSVPWMRFSYYGFRLCVISE